MPRLTRKNYHIKKEKRVVVTACLRPKRIDIGEIIDILQALFVDIV